MGSPNNRGSAGRVQSASERDFWAGEEVVWRSAISKFVFAIMMGVTAAKR